MKIPFAQFKKIIELYEQTKSYIDDFSKIHLDIVATELWTTWETLFDTTLSLCFGPVVCEEIWKFLLQDNSKFETIEELYDFVCDKYAEYITQNNPVTLEQLLKTFPQEPMFQTFLKSINKYQNNESNNI